jgi:hypothetical protein
LPPPCVVQCCVPPPAAALYSDAKVANRDVRIWHLEEWLSNDGQIQNPSAQS